MACRHRCAGVRRQEAGAWSPNLGRRTSSCHPPRCWSIPWRLRQLVGGGRDETAHVRNRDRTAQSLQRKIAQRLELGEVVDRARRCAGSPEFARPAPRRTVAPRGWSPCRSRCSRNGRQTRSGRGSHSLGRCRRRSRSRARAPPAGERRDRLAHLDRQPDRAQRGSGHGIGSLKNTIMPSPAKWSRVPS